jgi:hypothetical protein
VASTTSASHTDGAVIAYGSSCAVWFVDRVYYGTVRRYGLKDGTSKSYKLRPFRGTLHLEDRIDNVYLLFDWYTEAEKKYWIDGVPTLIHGDIDRDLGKAIE